MTRTGKRTMLTSCAVINACMGTGAGPASKLTSVPAHMSTETIETSEKNSTFLVLMVRMVSVLVSIRQSKANPTTDKAKPLYMKLAA